MLPGISEGTQKNLEKSLLGAGLEGRRNGSPAYSFHDMVQPPLPTECDR